MGCCCGKEKQKQAIVASGPKGDKVTGGVTTEKEDDHHYDDHEIEDKGEPTERHGKPAMDPPSEAALECGPCAVVLDKTTGDKAAVYVAQCDYTPESNAELSLKAGDILKTLPDRGGDAGPEWVFVTRAGGGKCGTGYVPRDHLAEKGTMVANLWYFGPMSRKDADASLRSASAGTFLVRDRDHGKSVGGAAEIEYTLSMKQKNGQLRHFPIWRLTEKYGGGYFLSKKRKFDDLETLIEWYKRHGESEENIILGDPPKKPTPRKVTLSADARKRWREIPRSQIQLGKAVGKGNFGVVYKGTWTQDGGQAVQAAIKVLKKGSAAAKTQFIKEAAVMKDLCHRNLVQLYGVVSTEEPYWLVTEFVKDGSLLKYLRSKKHPDREGGTLPERALMDISLQVANGMCYLEEKQVVHRDLAARNVLVDAGSGNERLRIKIADFGLAKMLADDSDPKTNRRRVGDIPTKWTAPEALSNGEFSTKSDVWSFGILMHEVFTYGGEPYEVFSNVFVRKYVVEQRQILRHKQQYIPMRVYEWMIKCFEYEPQNRPTFKDVYAFFNMYYGEPLETCGIPARSPDTRRSDMTPMPSSRPANGP